MKKFIKVWYRLSDAALYACNSFCPIVKTNLFFYACINALAVGVVPILIEETSRVYL